MQTGSITREAGAVIPSRTLAACAGFKPSITVSLTAFIARKDVQEQAGKFPSNQYHCSPLFTEVASQFDMEGKISMDYCMFSLLYNRF